MGALVVRRDFEGRTCASGRLLKDERDLLTVESLDLGARVLRQLDRCGRRTPACRARCTPFSTCDSSPISVMAPARSASSRVPSMRHDPLSRFRSPSPGLWRPHCTVSGGRFRSGRRRPRRTSTIARSKASPRPGRRRSRCGRRSGRGHGPASSRTARRTGRMTLRSHPLDLDRALPVAQLADVEVALLAVDPGDALPAEEDVAGRLHQPLARRPPARPGCRTRRVPTCGSSTDGLGLLGLEEQRVVVVPAEQQHDPAPGADAADADHLAGDVDEPVLLEQRAPVGGRVSPVVARAGRETASRVGSLRVAGSRSRDRDDQRRVGRDRGPPSTDW